MHLEVLCILGKHGQKGRVTTSSKEQMRSSVRVRVQGKITSKGGKEQGAMADHTRGLRSKVRTSCEKAPYIDHGDEDLGINQINGAKCKM
jgi:hypothetical protein